MLISKIDYKPSFCATFSRDRRTIKIFNDIDTESKSGVRRPSRPDYTALKANLVKLKSVYPNQEYSVSVSKSSSLGRDFLEISRTDGKGTLYSDMRVSNAGTDAIAKALISATDRILYLSDSEAVDFVAGNRSMADVASVRVL